MSILRAPMSGPRCLWLGFARLFDRRWRSLVLAPLAINALLFGAGSVWAAGRVRSAVQSLQNALPGWLDWLAFLAWPLFGLVLLLVFVYAFTALANLIGAPFNAVLAARVLGEAPVSGGGWLGEATRAVANELRKLAYFLVRVVPLGLLLWVPGVNLFAGPIWVLLGAWLLALEYLDYPLANRGLDFRAVRRSAGGMPLRTLGFGGSVLLLGMLPVVNLLLMPAAVIGACLLVRDQPAGSLDAGGQDLSS
ncbi:MAG: sulfate transporter CysZ [Immundisolibacter sp.]|uniref:sulfate transporter CysZ n=1 Tax=Immundisolibacter sp. TaxID=1934948 RepID=UPI003EDECCAE